MDKTITDSLILLGLDKLSIKFFLASFKLGPGSIPEIAKLARIKRSTAYLLAKNLISLGFLLEDHKLYANKIYAIDPEKLLHLVANKQRQLRRQEIELEDQLPAIRSIYQASEIRPKIQLYEGNNGLIQIWEDILSTKNEILLWTNQQTENQFFGPGNHDKFIKERLNKKIPIRVLATASLQSQELLATDKQSLRKTKILPKTTKFSAETYIYDHKIAILDYNRDIIGIIIESEPIATSHKSMFETTWSLI